MEVFGARAGPDMAAAIREGRFELDDAIATLQGTSGALADASERSLTLSDKWQLFKNRASLALLPLGNIIMDIAAGVLPMLEQGFERILSTVGPIMEGVGDAFDEAFLAIREGDGALGFVTSLVWNLAYSFAGGEEAAFAAAEKIESLWQKTISLSQSVRDLLSPILESISSFVSWKDVLFGLGIALGTVVIPIVVTLASTILTIAAPILALIAVVALLRNAWEADFGGIRDFAAGVWAAIQQGYAAFKALFSGDWNGFLAGISAAWNTGWTAVTTFLGNLWSMAQPHLLAFFASVSVWFTTTDWKALGQTVLDTVSTKLGELWSLVQPHLTTFFTNVSTWFTETDWKALGQKVIDYLSNKLGELWAFVEPKAIEFLASTTEWFETQDWETIAFNAVLGFLEAVSKWWGETKEVLGTAYTSMLEWFETTDWGAMGTAIQDGIIGGLATLAEALIGALTSAAKGAKAAWDEFWGIESPSKVMFEASEWMTAGSVAGLAELGPNMTSTMENAARMASGAFVNAFEMPAFSPSTFSNPQSVGAAPSSSLTDDLLTISNSVEAGGSFEFNFGEPNFVNPGVDENRMLELWEQKKQEFREELLRESKRQYVSTSRIQGRL